MAKAMVMEGLYIGDSVQDWDQLIAEDIRYVVHKPPLEARDHKEAIAALGRE